MKYRILALLMTVVLLLSGCGSSTDKMPENTERLKELAQEFIDDIGNIYLPLKDTPAEYTRMKMVVSAETGSYNVGLLQSFVESQQKEMDCAVTIAFTATSTVFSRIIYEDGVGYYLRYQYDEKKTGEALELASRYYDGITFTTNDTATRADLVLMAGKTKIATFSFKNIKVST